MNSNDSETFSSAWSAAWAANGRTLTDGAIEIVFEALRRYSIEDVLSALAQHLRDPDAGQYPPKPADIVRIIDGSNQLPTADQLVGLAMACNTPVGAFAKIEIGSFNLGSMTAYELRPFAEATKAKLAEFIERARAGNFSRNELALMVREKISPVGELMAGIKGPPRAIAEIVLQRMLHLQAPEPEQLPDLSKEQCRDNVVKLRNIVRGVA